MLDKHVRSVYHGKLANLVMGKSPQFAETPQVDLWSLQNCPFPERLQCGGNYGYKELIWQTLPELHENWITLAVVSEGGSLGGFLNGIHGQLGCVPSLPALTTIYLPHVCCGSSIVPRSSDVRRGAIINR